MGDYTEIVIKARIKSEIPKYVKDILTHMFDTDVNFDEEYINSILPDHKFFKCKRWHMIGSCSSSYHTPLSNKKYKNDRIFIRIDLKNYSGEIDSFIDWLMPYVNEFPGKYIGYKWDEYGDSKTLVYLKEGI